MDTLTEQLTQWLDKPIEDIPQPLPRDYPLTQRRLYAQVIEQTKAEARTKERVRVAMDMYDLTTPPVDPLAHFTHWKVGNMEPLATWRSAWWITELLWMGTVGGTLSFVTLVDVGNIPPFSQWVVGVATLLLLITAWFFIHEPPPKNDIYYNRVVPAKPLAAYVKAKRSHLFDQILVYSTDPNAFFISNPRVETKDPLIIGRIGEWHFLIAQWGLAEDLEHDNGTY